MALWAVVLLLLGLSWPAKAHNGKTAYAIPLEGITIDGKLNDWPEEMAVYPIEWVSPDYWKSTPPDGPEDLAASFRAGYDLKTNLLYLAITVQDDDLIVSPLGQYHIPILPITDSLMLRSNTPAPRLRKVS